MTVLAPMRPEVFATYRQAEVAGYAEENIASGRWPKEGALDRSLAEFDALLPQGLATPDSHLFEIRENEDGPTVGFLWFAVEERHGVRSAFVYDVSVGEAYRRRGHAKRAFRALEAIAASLGLSRIDLHVFGHNPGAQALYQQLGFTLTGSNLIKQLGEQTPGRSQTIAAPDGDTVDERGSKRAALAAKLIRNFNEVPLTRLLRQPHYDAQGSRLARGTAAQKLGASFDILEPGKRGCPYHLHHAQEEMFVILEGNATLRVAGEMLPVKAGDVIFMPAGPEYPHQIINTSDAPVRYLSISTMETPEICEYPDSGKFLAEGSLKSATPFEAIRHAGESADYWEGEP